MSVQCALPMYSIFSNQFLSNTIGLFDLILSYLILAKTFDSLWVESGWND